MEEEINEKIQKKKKKKKRREIAEKEKQITKTIDNIKKNKKIV